MTEMPGESKPTPVDINMSVGYTVTDMSEDSAVEEWPIRKLLAWTADFLKKKGSESPRLDAEVLLAKVLDWPRVQLYTHFEEGVGTSARAAYRALVRRRAEGCPVAYLVGAKEFYSLRFSVTPAVLIPRPDSEFVVLEFLAVANGRENLRAVDVGTGSGCLALACLSQHPSTTFFATDTSSDALIIASANADALGLSERISFHQGNLLDPVAGEAPFDVILSNPPYIPSADLAKLARDVKDHEPKPALDGGGDGLRTIEPLITQSYEHLLPGGSLIVEIGSDQEACVRALFEAHGGYRLDPTVRDHARRPRVIRAERRE